LGNPGQLAGGAHLAAFAAGQGISERSAGMFGMPL
jgi:hypothetical protein